MSPFRILNTAFRIPLLLPIFCLLFSALSAHSANWPQWRGPNAQGTSDAKPLPSAWSASEHIKWKADLPGGGDSSPSVWGDRIYIAVSIPQSGEIGPGHPDHPKKTGPMSQFRFMRYQFRLLAFDRNTGEKLWEQKVPLDKQRTTDSAVLFGNHANATPATDGSVVCAYFNMRWLVCYSTAGILKWQHEFPDEDPMAPGSDGDSPIIAGDRVIAVREGSTGASIWAFNKETGEVLWKAARDEKQVSYATPALLEIDGKKQVAVNAINRIRSYDFDSGKLIWECGGMTKGVIPTLVSANGLAYAASSAGNGVVMAIKLGRTGDLTGSDAIAWRSTKGAPHIATPLLYRSELYTITDNGMLTCFDAKTGKIHYDRQRVPGLTSVFASPVAGDGKIYLVGEDGKTVVVKPGTKFEVLATNTLPGKFHATPALLDGMILLREERHLFCVTP